MDDDEDIGVTIRGDGSCGDTKVSVLSIVCIMYSSRLVYRVFSVQKRLSGWCGQLQPEC